MKNTTGWNALRDKVHANAVEKGFWDENNSPEHYLCLVISELMEAVEADRKNRYANLREFDTECCERVYFTENFEQYVKDTVEDELADAVIRILDLAGAYTFSASTL